MPKNGCISATQVALLLVSGKGPDGFGVGAFTLARKIARESLGVIEEEISGKDIDRGNEYEPDALDRYREIKLVDLEYPGWAVHPDIPFFGGTADGLVGISGGVDTKCPNNANHHLNLVGAQTKDHSISQLDDHKVQFQSYMAIYDRQWWDMASYNPNYPEPLDMAILRMERDQEFIDKMLSKIKLFWPHVQKEIELLNKIKGTHV
jgi:hypothetical protein